jgi:DNA polymerase-3 subunit delta
MLLKGEQLAAHLERDLRPLYVLYGDEPLLVLEAADAIRAKSRQQGYSEREVLTVLPHFDWGQLLAAGGNMSLFGDKKLIDLRIPTGKPGKEGGAALQEWCKHLSADNMLLITLPELDWRDEKGGLVHHLGQCRHRDQADGPAAGRTAGLDCRSPAAPAAKQRSGKPQVHCRTC